MRKSLPWVLVFGLSGCLFGSKQKPLPRLGAVPLTQLCSDVERCDARGDFAFNTLKGKKAAPIFLADNQGPQHYLGKVAPERNANGVLKTCSAEVTSDDWLESGAAVREFDLPSDGKLQVKSALKAHLARALLARGDELADSDLDVAGTVESASRGLGLKRLSMISQTYWLKDAAFERRVGQCGEEEYKNIIYSLTLLELSELTRKELEEKLLDGLSHKLEQAAPTEPPTRSPDALLDDLTAPPASSADAGAKPPDKAARRAILREVAHDAVRDLAMELRMIAALGFDEP